MTANGHDKTTTADFLAHAPISVFQHEVSALQRVVREQQEEDEQRAREARAKAEAAAQKEYEDSLYACTERYREDDPPEAADLGVSVEDLSPARALLIRFSAWLARTRGELARMESAKEAFLDQLGAPAITQHQLDEIEAQDRSGFLSWLRSGADKATKPNIDEYRRKAVQDKLAEDTYQAAVARDALSALETEIEVMREAVRVLEGRHSRFAEAVVVAETGAELIEEYRTVCERAAEIVTQLSGLSHAVRSQRVSYGPLREGRTDLPGFGTVRPRIEIDLATLPRHATPWRRLTQRLIEDPHANLKED